MMATEMAVSYAAHHPNMTAVNFGHHGYPRHHHHHHHQQHHQHHHQMSGYDYYTPQRSYQDQVLSRHGEVQDDYDEEDDDVEDDDVEDSDNESLYTSADMDSELASEDLSDPEPNVAEQLLEFAEAVNRDIQKYFGRKKGSHEPDSLGTVYEDRFASGKSGRELYYADLLRVAQSGDAAEPSSSGRGRRGVNSSSSPRNMSTSSADNIDPVNGCTKGLGPLKELFDFALGGCVDETRIEHHHQGTSDEHRWVHRHQEPTGKSLSALPWRKRSLPTSFFVEPGAKGLSSSSSSLSRKCVSSSVSFGSHVAMVTEQDTPDFSDLVANFTSEYDTHIAGTVVSH
ncbi:protein PERCC1-like [Asterias amurensis]|uniref:protein PERCC1-like n=1 Tax=Asterias amurensis TaxID=7602 RepID=UPI003AB8BFDA